MIETATVAELLEAGDIQGLIDHHRLTFGTAVMMADGDPEGDPAAADDDLPTDEELIAALAAEDDDDDSEPEKDDKGKVKNGPNGFPLKTPVADMDADQRAEYWKYQAKIAMKKEGEAKKAAPAKVQPTKKQQEAKADDPTAALIKTFQTRERSTDLRRACVELAGKHADVVYDALAARLGEIELTEDTMEAVRKSTDGLVKGYIKTRPSLAATPPVHTGKSNAREGSGKTHGFRHGMSMSEARRLDAERKSSGGR